MKKQCTILVILLLCLGTHALFGQMTVSVDLYPWIPYQAGITVDYPLNNVVTVSASGFWYYRYSWLSTALSGAFGFRIYPFNGSDLGYRGFPKDLRDIGHFVAPYIRVDLEPAYISMDEDFSVSPIALLDVSLGAGVRFFPVRWFYIVAPPKKPVRVPIIDDLFLDFSIRYAYGLSRELLSLSTAQDTVVEKLLDPVRVQFSVGYCISF